MLNPSATKIPVAIQNFIRFVLRARSKKPIDSIPKKTKGTSGTAKRPRNPSNGKQSDRKAEWKASLLFVIGNANQ